MMFNTASSDVLKGRILLSLTLRAEWMISHCGSGNNDRHKKTAPEGAVFIG